MDCLGHLSGTPVLPGKLTGTAWKELVCSPGSEGFHQMPMPAHGGTHPRGHHSLERCLRALPHGIQLFPKSTGLCRLWKLYSLQEYVSVIKFSTGAGHQRGGEISVPGDTCNTPRHSPELLLCLEAETYPAWSFGRETLRGLMWCLYHSQHLGLACCQPNLCETETFSKNHGADPGSRMFYQQLLPVPG